MLVCYSLFAAHSIFISVFSFPINYPNCLGTASGSGEYSLDNTVIIGQDIHIYLVLRTRD